MGFNYEDSQSILFVFLENLANIKILVHRVFTVNSMRKTHSVNSYQMVIKIKLAFFMLFKMAYYL